MQIAESVDKFTDLQTTNVSNQMSQKRVTRNIKRDAEKRVRASLIKLAMEDFFIFNFELEKRVRLLVRQLVRSRSRFPLTQP